MGFMQKAAAALVTRYGKVIEGKYEGHTLCLGHDPSENGKPQVVHALAPKMFKQVIFMMDDEGKARHEIVGDIAQFRRIEEDDTTVKFHVVWCTTEQSIFVLYKEKSADKEKSGLAKGIGVLMKMGGTTKNSDSPEAKMKERYGDFIDFLFSFALVMDLETAEWFEEFADSLGYIPQGHMEIVKKAVSFVREHANTDEE